ncbi:RDD family protein [Spirochaetia bacterium]|nr:RDD family protein [Spirochaetia bacterium]
MPLYNTSSSAAASDTSLNATLPEGIEYVLYPAGICARACAFALDTVIQWSVIFAGIIVTEIFNGKLGTWFLLLTIFVVDWFYHFCWEIFGSGASPGKRLLGLRVVQNNGEPVSASASFLRNLLRFADTYLFLYLIASMCIALSPGFRRIGDWVAGTLVVWTSASVNRARAVNLSALSGDQTILPVVPDRPLTYEEKKAVLQFAARFPLLGKDRAREIAGLWTKGIDCKGMSADIYILSVARNYHGE